MVVVINKKHKLKPKLEEQLNNEAQILDSKSIYLEPENYERARTEAPGYNIYFLEQKFKNWIQRNQISAQIT